MLFISIFSIYTPLSTHPHNLLLSNKLHCIIFNAYDVTPLSTTVSYPFLSLSLSPALLICHKHPLILFVHACISPCPPPNIPRIVFVLFNLTTARPPLYIIHHTIYLYLEHIATLYFVHYLHIATGFIVVLRGHYYYIIDNGEEVFDIRYGALFQSS